eukprot:470781-Amphidinium_carterae.2
MDDRSEAIDGRSSIILPKADPKIPEHKQSDASLHTRMQAQFSCNCNTAHAWPSRLPACGTFERRAAHPEDLTLLHSDLMSSQFLSAKHLTISV